MSSFLIDYNEHGKWYNQWLDAAAEFKRDYLDHSQLHTVATIIVNRLDTGLRCSESDPMHSFNRYGSYEKTQVENLATLAQDVMAEVQTPNLRQYVVSFFHSGGANHEELADLFDLFIEFCDHAVIRDETDDESDASTIEDTASPNQPPPVNQGGEWGNIPVANEFTEPPAVSDWGQPSVQWSWGPTYSNGSLVPPDFSPYDPNTPF